MTGQEPDYDKLSPELETAFRAHREGDGRYLSVLSQDDEATQLVPAEHHADGKPARVVVTVECEPGTSFADITDPEIEINGGGGGTRTGIVALTGLLALTRHPGVHYISVTEPMDYYLDTAGVYVGLPVFRSSRGLTGKGVVVGIVDTGLDAGHPAFRGRIHSVWDQFVPKGRGVEGFSYGEEYTGTKVGKSGDPNGHGTHVCGIAAGRDDKYPGVAPGATIVAVRVKPTTVNVQNAISYVFQTAERLGMPAVVNISMGTQANPHDGSDPLCRHIDEVSKPGRIVCCAAGNDGNTGIHARASVQGAQPCDVTCWHFPEGSGIFDPLVIRGWYPASAEVKIALSRGTYTTPLQGPGCSQEYEPPDGGLIVIDTRAGRPDDRLRPFTIKVAPPEDTKEEHVRWTIQLCHEGSGRQGTTVDMWATRNGGFSRPHRSGNHTIGSPGCAASAITVGSFVTKVEWRNGTEREPELTLHAVDRQSSRGPRLDGVTKPNVVAPGAVVVSSRSGQASANRKYIVDDLHMVDQGTSMAAPFLTGIVALLLEENKKLDAKKALNLLKYAPVDGADVNTAGRGLVDLKNL